MKGLTGRQTRGLPKGARLDCIDNTGAKIVEIIEVKGYRGVRNRLSSAGIADLLVVTVKKGTPETRKQVMNAVVVRQRRPFRRPEGMMVQFEDNACVIVTPEGEVKGSDIKGPVAREAAERWPRAAAPASMLVGGRTHDEDARTEPTTPGAGCGPSSRTDSPHLPCSPGGGCA